MTETVAIVFLGGDRVSAESVEDLPRDAIVVGADSGIDHALALGWSVNVAIGDFDSVSAASLAAVEAAGATIDRHPAEKDQTDFELALARAIEMGAGRVIVVGGHGGRVDHFLGNTMVLLAERWAGVTIEARLGVARVHVLRASQPLTVEGPPGELVSLLAVTTSVTGIATTGLRYPLSGETLHPGSSRGVSNELIGTTGTIEVASGALLVVRPGLR